MAYCTQCGKALPDDSVFCSSCGVRVTSAAAPPLSDPPPSYTAAYNVPQPSRQSSGVRFLNTGLGFVLPAVLFIITLLIGSLTPNFFLVQNLSNVFLQYVTLAAIAFACVLCIRAKGPDLSLGAVMGLSGVIAALVMQSGGSWLAGLLMAVAAAAVIGAVNGTVNALIRIRSVVLTILISAAVTLAVSFGVRRIAFALTAGVPIQAGLPHISPALPAVILLLITLILAFFLNFGTNLGLPVYQSKRSVGLCIAAYTASSVIAALAGFYLLLRIQVAVPTIGMGHEMYILFVFACLISSRALDNRVAPVVYAMLPALIWCLLTNVLNLLAFPFYTQNLVFDGITLASLAIAFVCRYEKRPSRA